MAAFKVITEVSAGEDRLVMTDQSGEYTAGQMCCLVNLLIDIGTARV
jgi:hypothetical protein